MSDAECTPGREPRSVAASAIKSFLLISELLFLELTFIKIYIFQNNLLP